MIVVPMCAGKTYVLGCDFKDSATTLMSHCLARCCSERVIDKDGGRAFHCFIRSGCKNITNGLIR